MPKITKPSGAVNRLKDATNPIRGEPDRKSRIKLPIAGFVRTPGNRETVPVPPKTFIGQLHPDIAAQSFSREFTYGPQSALATALTAENRQSTTFNKTSQRQGKKGKYENFWDMFSSVLLRRENSSIIQFQNPELNSKFEEAGSQILHTNIRGSSLRYLDANGNEKPIDKIFITKGSTLEEDDEEDEKMDSGIVEEDEKMDSGIVEEDEKMDSGIVEEYDIKYEGEPIKKSNHTPIYFYHPNGIWPYAIDVTGKYKTYNVYYLHYGLPFVARVDQINIRNVLEVGNEAYIFNKDRYLIPVRILDKPSQDNKFMYLVESTREEDKKPDGTNKRVHRSIGDVYSEIDARRLGYLTGQDGGSTFNRARQNQIAAAANVEKSKANETGPPVGGMSIVDWLDLDVNGKYGVNIKKFTGLERQEEKVKVTVGTNISNDVNGNVTGLTDILQIDVTAKIVFNQKLVKTLIFEGLAFFVLSLPSVPHVIILLWDCRTSYWTLGGGYMDAQAHNKYPEIQTYIEQVITRLEMPLKAIRKPFTAEEKSQISQRLAHAFENLKFALYTSDYLLSDDSNHKVRVIDFGFLKPSSNPYTLWAQYRSGPNESGFNPISPNNSRLTADPYLEEDYYIILEQIKIDYSERPDLFTGTDKFIKRINSIKKRFKRYFTPEDDKQIINLIEKNLGTDLQFLQQIKEDDIQFAIKIDPEYKEEQEEQEVNQSRMQEPRQSRAESQNLVTPLDIGAFSPNPTENDINLDDNPAMESGGGNSKSTTIGEISGGTTIDSIIKYAQYRPDSDSTGKITEVLTAREFLSKLSRTVDKTKQVKLSKELQSKRDKTDWTNDTPDIRYLLDSTWIVPVDPENIVYSETAPYFDYLLSLYNILSTNCKTTFEDVLEDLKGFKKEDIKILNCLFLAKYLFLPRNSTYNCFLNHPGYCRFKGETEYNNFINTCNAYASSLEDPIIDRLTGEIHYDRVNEVLPIVRDLFFNQSGLIVKDTFIGKLYAETCRFLGNIRQGFGFGGKARGGRRYTRSKISNKKFTKKYKISSKKYNKKPKSAKKYKNNRTNKK